jgi:double-stranded RNA-binding protein Staufen
VESDSSKSLNTSMNSNGTGSETDGDDSLLSDIKSPISIVHEMALKRKLIVIFEVQSEKGPPHMKVYTTLCKVGNLTVSKRK